MNRIAASLLLLALALAPVATAQNITGTILGAIADQSGAALPGASLEIVNLETNQTTRVESNAIGIYEAPYLRPGAYRVTASKAGFKRATRDAVELRLEDRLRLDFRLEVGDTSTSVEVTGEAPLVESETASLGEVVSTRAIEELPTLGRNIFDLVGLAAGVLVNPRAEGGVASTGAASTPLFVQSDISINGGRYRTNEYLVDGVSIMLPENNNFAFAPTPDGTQEFKVLTNSFGPQYGRSGGGVVNVVTRGGSNALHGGVYEYFRNERFKANNFFNNARGLERGSFHFNQFGASLGGRVRRDRTFFFAEYQGHRELIGGGSGILTVPTSAEASGDFSRRVNATGQPVIIYDPSSNRVENGVTVRSAFAGNIIPIARQSPLARNLIQFLPAPNRAGEGPAGINNYVWSRRQWVNSDQWNVRLDHRFSDRLSLFGRLTRNTGDNGSNGPYNTIADNVTGFTENRVWNGMLNLTDVLTPAWILNLRFGVTRRFEGRVPLSAGKVDLTKLGFAPNIAAAVEEQIFPLISIQNFASMGPPSGDRIRRGNQVYTAVIEQTLMRGRHTFIYGADIRSYDQTPYQAAAASGSYSFNPAQTRGPDPLRPTLTSGEALASYLLGFGSGSISSSAALAIRNMYYGLYVNDDIKLGRLTINAGVRWEHERPRTERYNRFGVFDFTAPFPIQVAGQPNLRGVLRYAGQDGLPRGQVNPYYRNFGPRVGLAYRVNARSVVRAGYGIFFAPRFGTTGGNNFGTPGYSVTTPWVSSLDDLNLINPFDNPFPSGLLQRPGDAADRYQLGQSILISDRGNAATAYNQQWNFSVQRQLPRQALIEVSYTGNKGTRLPVSLNYNQVDPQYQSLGSGLNRTVANPFFGLVPSGTLSLRTVSTLQMLRPFPQYVSVSTNSPALAENIGSSSYHALQIRIQKRFAKGYNFLVTYTNSKLIDNGSGRIFGESAFVPPVQNSYNLAGERSISEGDVPQRVAMNHTVELPFGKGKPYLAGAGPVAQHLISGWVVTGVLTWQRGFPLVLTSIGNSGVGGSVLRPNSTGKSANLTGEPQSRLTRYFDISQFTVPTAYTFGNVTRTLPDVRGPSRIAYNLSLQKAFRVAEGKQLSFRADSFNLSNTPYFQRPGQGLGSTNFGVIDTAVGERIVQFALKLRF
jgi:hypothetical protein